MKTKINWTKIIFITGTVALILGAIDPLEGSIVIIMGCALISFAAFSNKDYYRKMFLSSLIMIVIGVSALFFFSDLGGFGGSSTLSWWWAILILPYPMGWLVAVITLIIRRSKKEKGHVLN